MSEGSSPPPDTSSLDRGRRLARRWMAWLSFAFLFVTGCLIVYGVIISPARESVATALDTASAVMGSLTGFFTILICAYLGVSFADKWVNGGKK